VVIAAQRAGKLKTVIQDVFIGATILWFGWKDLAAARGWRRGWLGALWEQIHGTVVAVTLGIAIVVTVYSLAHYLYRYRSLFRGAAVPRADGR
jgi:phosphatidylglycerophosphate synthase